MLEAGEGATAGHGAADGRVADARGAGARRHGLGRWVALALVVLAIAAVVRYRYGWLLVRGPEYAAAFHEVSGLGAGAEVRYAGLAVGRVRRVTIDPADERRVLVTIRVHEGTPVRADTRLSVVAAGGRPVSYVNLHPSAPTAPRAEPGRRLASVEGPTIVDVLQRVTLVLDRTDTLLAAAAPLTETTFFADLGRTLARVDTLATAVSRGADRWGPQLERAVRHTDDLLVRTARIVATLDSARPALARAPGEMVTTLEQSRALLTDLRTGVDEGGGLRAMMRDLTAASDDLARLAERLERDPLSALQRRGLARKTTGPSLQE